MDEKPATYYDCHVHVVGNEFGNNGCWFNPKRFNSPAFRSIRYIHGISQEESKKLDKSILTRLETQLKETPNLKIVALAFDWARDDDGETIPKLSDFYVPNDYILNIARNNPQILAGVSIHPFRKDSIEELHRCKTEGATLLKWLPVSQNFDPLDKRCIPFYKSLAKLKIPLLCHTGSEGATRNINKKWNNPRMLELALDRGVTVIAAHCGMRSLPHDKDYLNTWIDMLKDYPHLYGDTAALLGLRVRKLLNAINRENVAERLIHGSDWPVPESPWWTLGIIPLKQIIKLRRIKNHLRRDIETKKAIGIGKNTFTRFAKIANLQ